MSRHKKLDETQTLLLRELYEKGMSFRYIRDYFHIDRTTIYDYLHRMGIKEIRKRLDNSKPPSTHDTIKKTMPLSYKDYAKNAGIELKWFNGVRYGRTKPRKVV